jgi:hypothetical protein
MRDPVFDTRIRRKSKKAVYLVNNLKPDGVPSRAYNVRTFHGMRRAGVPMKSPMTRKPITKGWKRMFKNSELPLGTERARLRTYMKNKMKLTAAQKANYIKRLNNGESFNKIINTINRTTVPKTNFKSKPPFSKKLFASIGFPTSYPPDFRRRIKRLRTHIMQELADLEKRISTNVPKVYEARMRTLVKYVMEDFVDQYQAAERDMYSIYELHKYMNIYNIWSPFSSDFLIQLKLGIRKTESETLEKVAKAGMGIISRQFSIWFTKAGYPDPAPEFWSFIVKDIEAHLVHSRQKIIVTAMMRTSRNTNKFSQLNKKVQILMKSETGELYKHPIEFVKKYLLPLTREHKAVKTIQKVVRGGQVRNKIRKNANNLREKLNRAEKLRSVVQASKKRKTPASKKSKTPASSTRIKK